jgi:hypothetical protein
MLACHFMALVLLYTRTYARARTLPHLIVLPTEFSISFYTTIPPARILSIDSRTEIVRW